MFRNWTDYEAGFGDLTGNFWLGLEKIRRLTTTSQKIYILTGNWQGGTVNAIYNNFQIADSSDNYRLIVSSFSGGNSGNSWTAGDHPENGNQFTTIDRDNDDDSGRNCAVAEGGGGGWWYGACHDSNLNGIYYPDRSAPAGDGIVWVPYKPIEYSMAREWMMIKPMN